ncbi:unnamed protein product [Wickerhamomyces anomalus]
MAKKKNIKSKSAANKPLQDTVTKPQQETLPNPEPAIDENDDNNTTSKTVQEPTNNISQQERKDIETIQEKDQVTKTAESPSLINSEEVETEKSPEPIEVSETIKIEPQQEDEPIVKDQPTEIIQEPIAPTVKKRLTLQERLALAAKSGKSKRSTSGANATDDKKLRVVSPEPSTRETSIEPQTSELSKVATPISEPISAVSTRDSSLDIKRSEPITLFPKDFKNLPVEELQKLITDAETKFSVLESKNESLTIEKQSLQEKIKNISSSISATSSSSASAQIIKEKDEKIAQLLKEGENLSMKELKYTNTIKRLKSIEADNDKEIWNLKNTVDSLEDEKKKFKEENKKLKDSEQQFSVKSKTLQIQLDNEKESLQEEINRNKELSKKIEELSQVLIQEKNQASNIINELKRSLEKEKQKAQTAQEESMAEINRLESKIEQLRYQSENAQAHTTTNDESYLKLIRQHDTLQNQYTSATENWQSIEASLMSKISNFETSLSSYQEKLKSSEEKNDILSNDLRSKTLEIENLTKDLKNLRLELSRCQNKLDQSTKDYEELQTTLESKEISFNKEKAELEYKVSNLERQFKDSIQPQHLTVQSSSNLGEFSPQMPQNSSTPSFRRGLSWDIGLGESSTTPRQSRKSSALYFPNYSQANGSFEEKSETASDFDDNDTVNSPVSQYHNGSRYDNNSSSALGGTSVQLLGKMSSQVRRLETELSTMKEELEKLSEDKKAANEEIVKLMKDNENVGFYKSKIEELEIQVDNYSKRHEKTLEILGEKSEQVEELKADVQDLKDLCRQQVQQLVDLQTR